MTLRATFPNPDRADVYRGMFWGSFGVGIVSAVWGIVDGVVRYKIARRQVGRSRLRRSSLLNGVSGRVSMPALASGTCRGPGVPTRPFPLILSSVTPGSTARKVLLFLNSGGRGLHYRP